MEKNPIFLSFGVHYFNATLGDQLHLSVAGVHYFNATLGDQLHLSVTGVHYFNATLHCPW